MAGLKIREVDGEFIRRFEHFKKSLEGWSDVAGYVAMDLNRIVGLIVVAGNRIHYVYVEEESRRAGIATQLIKYVINIAPKNGVPVCAITSFSNRAAQALLIKAGMNWWGRSISENSVGWLFRAAEPTGESTDIVNRENRLSEDAQRLIHQVLVMEVAPVII